jgi:hypothetical protein
LDGLIIFFFTGNGFSAVFSSFLAVLYDLDSVVETAAVSSVCSVSASDGSGLSNALAKSSSVFLLSTSSFFNAFLRSTRLASYSASNSSSVIAFSLSDYSFILAILSAYCYWNLVKGFFSGSGALLTALAVFFTALTSF